MGLFYFTTASLCGFNLIEMYNILQVKSTYSLTGKQNRCRHNRWGFWLLVIAHIISPVDSQLNNFYIKKIKIIIVRLSHRNNEWVALRQLKSLPRSLNYAERYSLEVSRFRASVWYFNIVNDNSLVCNSRSLLWLLYNGATLCFPLQLFAETW